MGAVIKIAVGADHAGIVHKKEIIKTLEELGHEVEDLGVNSLDSVDYPDYAKKVAGRIASGGAEMGVLVCGTGIGMSITANKVSGIRAALCCSTEAAELTRQHNNANVLCMGARTLTIIECIKITRAFFSTSFSTAKRHSRRVKKMES